MSAACNPVLVEIWRGSVVESRHRGAAAVARADGSVVAAWGTIGEPILPRSAIKPFQAIPLVESGAADRFGFTAADLALACASHSGEAFHINGVASLLRRLRLSAADLVCGGHLPYDDAAARALIRAGRGAGPLYNNCSGKHAGFLATALHHHEPTGGYVSPAHPVQRRVRLALSEMVDSGDGPLPDGVVDGCGAPNFPITLQGLAMAMARLADPRSLHARRAGAVRRIVAAMVEHPVLVAGSGRFDTVIMQAAAGAIVSKGGAEGIQAAALPGAGLGLAVKIDDGGKRAAQCAMATLLARYGRPNGATRAALAGWLETPVLTAAGQRAGTIRAAVLWSGDPGC